MRILSRSSIALLAIGAVLLLRRKAHAKQPGAAPPGKSPPQTKVPNVLTMAQLRELAAAVGMADSDVGAAVAMAESGGRTNAIGDHGDSIGLWQIHVPSCPKEYANRDMLKHAGFNAQAALAISNGGTQWDHWTTYRNGSYQRFLAKGR